MKGGDGAGRGGREGENRTGSSEWERGQRAKRGEVWWG